MDAQADRELGGDTTMMVLAKKQDTVSWKPNLGFGCWSEFRCQNEKRIRDTSFDLLSKRREIHG